MSKFLMALALLLGAALTGVGQMLALFLTGYSYALDDTRGVLAFAGIFFVVKMLGVINNLWLNAFNETHKTTR